MKQTNPNPRGQQMPWNIPLEVYGSEQELLQGLYQQEEPACTCLFKRFARQLYAVALRMVKSQEEAEEILQEAFLHACSHITDFEQRSRLPTWLHRIVANTALMHLRRRNLDASSLEEAQEQGAEEATPEELTPDAQVLDQELRKALHVAVEQLPETLRIPFLLRAVEGRSTREAAQQLNISEGTLKVRLHRARQALRKLMHGYLQEEGRVSIQIGERGE